MANVDARPAPVSPKAPRAEWLRATSVDAYETIGERSPAWDAPARAALAAFAQLLATYPNELDEVRVRVGENAHIAVAAGCSDPLVRYLQLRYSLAEQSSPAAERFTRYQAVANQMLNSKYHPLRKLFVCLRVADAHEAAFPPPPSSPLSPESQWFRGNAVGCLYDAFRDPNLPATDAVTACGDIMSAFKYVDGAFEHFFLTIEPLLRRNYPSSHIPHLIMGKFWTEHAWNARGFGYADTVTTKGWQGMEERLGKAEAELDTAWKITPNDERIAIQMITLELGQGQGRARMEQWFQRAMAIDPASYAACTAKLYYLEPKWHGSPDAMLAFGRECVDSTVWRGTVPLIIVDAHERLEKYLPDGPARKSYWKQPAVWLDIDRAYTRFFTLSPEATAYRPYHARYAYRCEQWATLKEQLKHLGEADYAVFGGKAEFEKMQQRANAGGTK